MTKRTGAIVVGSLAALAFFSAIGLAVAKSKSDESGSPTSPEAALEWMNASLGIPTSLNTTTLASGRTYQVARWVIGGKEALLITSLSPKAIHAVQRDTQDRMPQVLVSSLPDDASKLDVDELVRSF